MSTDRPWPVSKPAEEITLTTELRDLDNAAWWQELMRLTPYTRYNDPALRTVHEVAARALNPPMSHVEIIR